MPKHKVEKFSGDELLFRLLRPKQWSGERDYIDPSAFRDDHKPRDRGLSMQVSSLSSPFSVLEKFANLKGIRRDFDNPTPLELYKKHGFGVAAVRISVVDALGLDFVRNDDGSIKIDSGGHVQVWDGRTRAADFALVAEIVAESRIFSKG